jgi:hypothetical protein
MYNTVWFWNKIWHCLKQISEALNKEINDITTIYNNVYYILGWLHFSNTTFTTYVCSFVSCCVAKYQFLWYAFLISHEMKLFFSIRKIIFNILSLHLICFDRFWNFIHCVYNIPKEHHIKHRYITPECLCNKVERVLSKWQCFSFNLYLRYIKIFEMFSIVKNTKFERKKVEFLLCLFCLWPWTGIQSFWFSGFLFLKTVVCTGSFLDRTSPKPFFTRWPVSLQWHPPVLGVFSQNKP